MKNKMMTVEFQGAVLYGFRFGDKTFVAVKPIADAMGLDWEGQRQRIKRDPILSEATFITKVPSPKGPQDSLCLHLDYLNGWMFKIQSARIADADLRAKVQAFQRECYRVLNAHFSGNRDRHIREENESTSLNLRLCQEARHIHGNYAADQLWSKLGLPRVPAMEYAFRQSDLFDSRRVA